MPVSEDPNYSPFSVGSVRTGSVISVDSAESGSVTAFTHNLWIHNKCSLITESEFDSVENTNCTWICQKCDFFNFSDSFFADQLNLENENRFDPLANGSGTKASKTGSDKNKIYHWIEICEQKHQ